MTSNIPYIKTLYSGRVDDKKIIYSPTFYCPHLISEQLNSRLFKFKNENLIEEYNLQIIREKTHHCSLTNYPYKASVNTFKNLINEEDKNLRKYTFAIEKKDFSMEYEDKETSLDYNILYFISLLKGKYLLKSRYMIWMNEAMKLYEKNDISSTDEYSQIDLLNQLEIRARKKGLLSFALFMRNFTTRGNDILVFEMLNFDDTIEKEYTELTDRLRIFSFLGQMKLYDRYVFTIPGLNHTHPVAELIKNTIDGYNIESNFYTINLKKSKFIPFHELYDFDENKWKLF